MNERTKEFRKRTIKECLLDMRSKLAWEISDKQGVKHRLIFAHNEVGAFKRSNLKGFAYEDVIIERAPYADGLKGNALKLVEIMNQNGWDLNSKLPYYFD